MVSEISILIPVYNFFIDRLVNELLAQCEQAAINFEIICLDDASHPYFQNNNRCIKNLKHVIYEELPVNVSRAAIRNLLAHRAQFAYLLFLDNDSEIISQEYILQYLQAAHPYKVLVGGTLYQDNQPTDQYLLHWKYGRNREQKPVFHRNQHPYRSLHVNNALIPRNILLEYPFNEQIIRYGHEDSEWGMRLEQANIPVLHIENPVGHLGIEPCELFLKKSQQAVINLHWLYYAKGVGTDTALLKWYLRLSRFRLKKMFYWLYTFTKPLIMQNLRSTTPNLFYFDLYRLGLFVQADFRQHVEVNSKS